MGLRHAVLCVWVFLLLLLAAGVHDVHIHKLVRR